ncbi:hypothetical protein ABZW18_34510 [Streptomyces sp. NPDC004647]|uniref:hypothetical protein n=1 Tax=Streptomyces sp. NPDC004647 TaxID=3154671 RepID=UPI0033A81744
MVTQSDLALLDLPERQLDVMLGEALTAEEFGKRDYSDIERQAVARRWLTANLGRIRSAVCGPALRAVLRSAEAEKRNLLFAAVADALIVGFQGLPVPVAVLAARLVHYGLDDLCGPATVGEGAGTADGLDGS